MRKQWLWISIIGLLLTACESTTPPNNTLPPLPHTGPATEIDGVEPRYEPYNIGTMKDYKIKGKNYRIVTDPETFSEVGLATWYGQELHGNKTALGEIFNANELTAAHPTLPLPSYVRVTNLSNNRQLVVRVNDRGPFTPGRIIDLSKAAAERLNVTNQTKVRLDVIIVAPDGTLSGPGTIGTEVMKKTYALPDRPNLGGPSATNASPMMAIGATPVAPAQQAEAVNIPTQPDNSLTVPTPAAEAGSLTLSAPQQGSNVNLPAKPESRVAIPTPAQESTPLILSAPSPQDKVNVPAKPDAVASVPAPTEADNANMTKPTSGFVVQVGALNDSQRAEEMKKKFSDQYNVPGIISTSGAFYRIQLGPFATKKQAEDLQQRLSKQGQPNTFIMSTTL